MKNIKFGKQLEKILKTDERFWDKEKRMLLRNTISENAEKFDKKLLEILLSGKATKEHFFKKVGKVVIFDKDKFLTYINNKNFLENSYTKFTQNIGLTEDGQFLKSSGKVVLNWPYKDCVLEGGQTKEDQKRNEIFFNEILEKDEIDVLLKPKVFSKFKKYSLKNGKARGEKLEKFARDKNGTIKDNLIIKGNNLIALHSLKEEFAGKVKLIYIDSPYNTGNDSFKYNDNFNHATWLTFMKNRLEVARDLLRDNGVIFVQCDHHEISYLNILMDEIFNKENKVQVISVKTSSPAGFKTVNPGPVDVTEYILFYSKNKNLVDFKKSYTAVDYDSNYNLYIDNIDDDPKKWVVESVIDRFYKENGVKDNKDAKNKWGIKWNIIRDALVGDFVLQNANKVASKRDPHKPTQKIKDLILKSKNSNYVIECKRENNNSLYLYKNGSLAFCSNKLHVIDGKLTPTELLTDFWSDISWAGISNEGGISLKNGKKPEKLLQRIIEMSVGKDDIILDYFSGAGTTGAVAHKMGVQYILVEQMDYIRELPELRLKNVIEGDQTGISKSVNWKGGGEFVYMEMEEFNQKFVNAIKKAKKKEDLKKIYKQIKEKAFLSYRFVEKEFKAKISEFNNLDLSEQKQVLDKLLDKNQLYIPHTEIKDITFKVSKKDIEVNRNFYGK